jgi:hypothetical protein
VTDFAAALSLAVGADALVTDAAEEPARNSEIVRLRVRWAPDGAGPPRIVAKRARDGDDREAAIYAAIRAGTPRLAAIAPSWDLGDGWLALIDLSETHGPAIAREDLLAGNGVPAPEKLAAIVDALAAFHAAWWEHPRLGAPPLEVRDWFADDDAHARHVGRRRRELEEFLATHGDSLTAGRPALLREALALLPRLWPALRTRVASRVALTLTHGDCYLNQLPVSTADGRAILLDLGDAGTNFAAYDLAYLLPTFWTRAQRAEHEEPVLRRYHEGLVVGGVRGFPYEVLRDDYRRMVAHMVFDPVFNAVDGSSRGYWEVKLECLADAWEDLDCAGLAS